MPKDEQSVAKLVETLYLKGHFDVLWTSKGVRGK